MHFLFAQLNSGSAWLLIVTVFVVGVLHTIVPDHWVPIALIARQRGWSRRETARAAMQAGFGHVTTTLLLAIIVWVAGVVVAARFGHVINTLSSVALIAFGAWIAITAWREIHSGEGHGDSHHHDFSHLDPAHTATAKNPAVHGPECQHIRAGEGEFLLSIYETRQLPRFRFSAVGPVSFDSIQVETIRAGGDTTLFNFANCGEYWESTTDIPEPHGFEVIAKVSDNGAMRIFPLAFAEHEHSTEDHGHQHATHNHASVSSTVDTLYAPMTLQEDVVNTHIHSHRHSDASPAHRHSHDHSETSNHRVSAETEAEPPIHTHQHKTTSRTALLLILGSSPMIEGIPAFFAAGKFGVGVIILMALVFGLGTIATYVLLCVYSTTFLQQVKLGAIEKYGEVLSGAFIALVGIVFWFFPVL